MQLQLLGSIQYILISKLKQATPYISSVRSRAAIYRRQLTVHICCKAKTCMCSCTMLLEAYDTDDHDHTHENYQTEQQSYPYTSTNQDIIIIVARQGPAHFLHLPHWWGKETCSLLNYRNIIFVLRLTFFFSVYVLHGYQHNLPLLMSLSSRRVSQIR